MTTWHTINTAGLLLLIGGYFLVGVFCATVVASAFTNRAYLRGVREGWNHAEDYFGSSKRR